MARSGDEFARLLTEGVYQVSFREIKTLQAIQDELGYALEKRGGASIEYWRKGHVPAKLSDVEKLAREIVKRGRLKRDWLEKFLRSADHPYPEHFCDELFSPLTTGESQHSFPKPILSNIDLKDEQMVDDSLPTPEFNPFVVGPPVVHPRHFFGREFELKRIFNLWNRFPLQNVAVVGLKRSGKTSLLHYLMKITTFPPDELRPGQRTDWLPQPEHYHWILVDFQDARMYNRERLLRYLLMHLNMLVPEPCTLEDFLDIVSQHLKTPTIILMDEIGAGLASPELDQQFWSSLRSLGSNLTGGNLAFILTAHEPPMQLAQDKGKPSPFFNIFGHTFTLGPLTEAEARGLIASSPQSFEAADVEWILARSEGWPCLLQILCHARLTALEEGETGDSWKKEGLRQMAPFWYLLD